MITQSFLVRTYILRSAKNARPMKRNLNSAHPPASRQSSVFSLSGFPAFIVILVAFFATAGLESCNNLYSESKKQSPVGSATVQDKDSSKLNIPTVLDTATYLTKLKKITNGDSSGRWPVKVSIPNAGAILPFKRIVAYYGNFYSKKMGVLGEYPAPEMLQRLNTEVKKWEAADSTMAVQPALHYIAVTAQGSPGKGGKYRLRMPFSQIDSVLKLAEKINALVFLDVQVGLSNVQEEIPLLEKYLKMPQVHLGIDPEFSMKTEKNPGP